MRYTRRNKCRKNDTMREAEVSKRPSEREREGEGGGEIEREREREKVRKREID